METEKIFNRKKELIKRDPLYAEFSKTFQKITNNKKNILTKYLNVDPVLDDIMRYYATPYCPDKDRDNHEKQYPDHWKVFRLKGELGLKWHISISFDGTISPYTNDEVICVGKQPFNKYTTSAFYPALHWLPYPNPFNKEPVLADINEFVTDGYNETGETWIPIIINVSRLNRSDAKKIKRHIWELVESRLQKGSEKKPYDEHSELTFLYSLRREDTLKKYLEWYDLHTKEKLGFRVLALYEKQKDKSAFLEKARCKKIKWGNPVKGEDKIEKAVKLIFKAIHRGNYSRKKIEPLLEEYNCHTHKNDCPLSCKYFKEWQSRFNRLNPV